MNFRFLRIAKMKGILLQKVIIIIEVIGPKVSALKKLCKIKFVRLLCLVSNTEITFLYVVLTK